jgi:hypothetical protein
MHAELSFPQAVALALLTFALSTVAGALLGFYLSGRTWERQIRMELQRQRYDEGTKFLEELSQLIGRRFFLLQRFLWSLRSSDPQRVAEFERRYFEAVDDWNFAYWLNRNKIRLLVSERQAELFLAYSDDDRARDPRSLRYSFVRAHRLVLHAKDSPDAYAAADEAVTRLNWKCSAYLEHLTKDFVSKATSLDLLELPDARLQPKISNI